MYWPKSIPLGLSQIVARLEVKNKYMQLHDHLLGQLNSYDI